MFCYNEGLSTESTWNTLTRVYDYKSYTSVQMMEYKVPNQANASAWFFHGLKSSDKCEERTIIIYLQNGGLPLINPLNETFPERFNLHRTDLQTLTVKSDNGTAFYEIDQPLPGSWFAVAFLGDYIDDKITQKGLGITCNYYFGATHFVEAIDVIPDIKPGVDIAMNVSSANTNWYRFLTTERTWEYNITILGCQFEPNPNATFNHSIPFCPLKFMVRDLALPSWNSETTYSANCSGSVSSCDLNVHSPSTSAWQYLQLETEEDGIAQIQLLISLRECEKYPPFAARITQITVPKQEKKNISTLIKTADSDFSFLPLNISLDEYLVYNKSSDISNIFDRTLTLIHYNATPSSLGNMDQSHSSAMETGKLSSEDTASCDVLDASKCIRYPELGRSTSPSKIFQVKFLLRTGFIPVSNNLLVSDVHPVILKFTMQPIIDAGGTLRFHIRLFELVENDTNQIVSVHACIQKGKIPIRQSTVSCHDDNYQLINNTVQSDSVLYFPYPESGSWYVSLLAICYRNNTSGNNSLVAEPCIQAVVVSFEIEEDPCVDGGCGENGNCGIHFSGNFYFSSCKCIGGWRGYACTDDSNAMSDAKQLEAALLLTLSNLFFIPAIILALHRRFFVEALVYTYTMFFSTFYHACDGDRKYIYCMMPYGVLAHCDFFGSIMSFWVTILGMAKLMERPRSFLYVFGSLALAVAVTWDRHSLWTFLVPCATALVIMILSWSIRCYHRRQCYPSKKRWLLYLIPGTLIAATGLIIFAFFETESNYQYTHSTWHACMALCIVFLLPPKITNKPVTDLPTDTISTASDVNLIGYATSDEIASSGIYSDPASLENANSYPV